MATKTKKTSSKFTIDCEAPVSDSVMSTSSLADYLSARIKVNGKAGALGDAISLEPSASAVTISADIPFSKRYLKYLSKKYLKKQKLREYVRVVATSKDTYSFVYFQTADDAAEEDED